MAIVDLVREHGTEVMIESALQVRDNVEAAVQRQARFLARLVFLLERKHIMRRVHVINLIKIAAGIEEEVNEDFD